MEAKLESSWDRKAKKIDTKRHWKTDAKKKAIKFEKIGILEASWAEKADGIRKSWANRDGSATVAAAV